jgi:putative transferase (TIGR04331 family)
MVKDFINLLPSNLLANFILRPRKEKNFWNTEHTLEVSNKDIAIDYGDFTESFLQAKIVIIDHLTTGFAEIIMTNTPMMILFHNKIPLAKEYDGIIQKLSECGVFHTSVDSAIQHLSLIYEDVQKWWNSKEVQSSVTEFKNMILAPSSKTIDFLLSCLNQN